jgi:hypothetical protein
MKFAQFTICGFLLTLSAGAQTAATPAAAQTTPSTTSSSAPATPSKPMVLSTPDGDTVKGPEHPLTLEQMKELYVAMGYDKTIDQNLQTMITMQKTRAPYIPTDFWDDLDSSFKKIDYPTALLDVYKKYLSTDDAAKLIEFSKTEAGKHFLENLPDVSRQVAIAIQRQQQQTGLQVQARHKDEMEAAIKKYQEEHAPKAPATPPASGTTPATPGASSAPATTPAPASKTPNN